MRIIRNFNSLAGNRVRRDVLTIVEAGYQVINIKNIFNNAIRIEGNHLSIKDHEYDLTRYKNIYVVGIGKGSALAVAAVQKILKKRIRQGYAIDIRSKFIPKIKVFKGTHPLPSEQNITATSKIIELLKSATEDDLIITVICGGGSSLFCQPSGLTCVELQDVTNRLLKNGAKIQEINTVRKHLSLIHGGFFAQYAYPATVATMIVSDVPGDDLNFVASGPTVLDKTTKKDAEKIAKRYKLSGLEFTETPKDPKYFKNITNIMVASGSLVVDAMAEKARMLGYEPRIYSKNLSGLAKDVGVKMASSVKPGEALLACGETQVIVTHPGKGGRNQDVALSAAPVLAPNSAIISAASDGKDNVPVAGALIDNPMSVGQLQRLRIDPTDAVEKNAGYNALKRLKTHLRIRHTTANISDFIAVIRRTP
ncbi:DUF4147 domain-containing protein [Candidatus Saccharibacteria bacterium]|nr:DUF4147 domain-containing protein [Candidatus Saccharibacteria bacterium]